jgi:hypothetical protein
MLKKYKFSRVLFIIVRVIHNFVGEKVIMTINQPQIISAKTYILKSINNYTYEEMYV